MFKNSIGVQTFVMFLVLGGCSQRASAPGDRIPANAESQYFKVTSHYFSVRDLSPQPDPSVNPVVRVFQSSPNLKISQVSVRNPSGNLYCQKGSPAQSPNFSPGASLVKDVYVFTPPADDSVYCYSWGALRAPLDVDYMVPKASVNLAELQLEDAPKLTAAVKELELGKLSPDSRAVIDNAGLITKETLRLTLPAQKNLPSITFAVGDVIDFRGIEGKVATSAKTLVSGPIGPDGRAQSATAAKTAPAAIKANAALLEPNSRTRQVYCTVTAEGEKPEVIYRGGDGAIAFADKAGKLACGINAAKKGAEKLAGQFELTLHYIKKDVALPQLSAQAKSKEEARLAAERKATAEVVQIVAGATTEWVEFNQKMVARYDANIARQNNQAKVEAEQGPELRARRAYDLEKTDKLFPSRLEGDFARGNFTFKLVSRPSVGANGVTYVSYLIDDGHTYMESKTEGMTWFFLNEQPFRPIFEIMTQDVWAPGSAMTGVPQKFVACSDRLEEVGRVMHELAFPQGGHAVPGFHDIFEKLAKVTVTDDKECVGWVGKRLLTSPTVEHLSFSRQAAFHFCYVKEARTQLGAGGATAQYLGYAPRYIDALYLAANGGQIKKRINQGHPFFSTTATTNTRWDQVPAGDMAEPYCISSPTAFPEMQANGLIQGF